MKEIIIKRINVASVMKPLLLISGSIGLVLGIIASLFYVPVSSFKSISGNDVVSTYTTPISDVIGGVVGIIFSTVISALVIAFVIGAILLLFNLFCRMVGGIKIEIEETN